MTDRPVVALCAGKDCAKRCEFAKIRATLRAEHDVVELACVGICSGPVVVVRPEADKPVVLSKLRTKRDRERLVALIASGKAPRGAMKDRVVSKSKRTSTIKKVRRVVPLAS